MKYVRAVLFYIFAPIIILLGLALAFIGNTLLYFFYDMPKDYYECICVGQKAFWKQLKKTIGTKKLPGKIPFIPSLF